MIHPRHDVSPGYQLPQEFRSSVLLEPYGV
jgi:hypothetical protein